MLFLGVFICWPEDGQLPKHVALNNKVQEKYLLCEKLLC
jgi:hypothetical protein